MLSDIKTILYSTDLKGDGREKAFKMAIGLAKSTGAHMIIVHAMEPSAKMLPILETVLSDEMLDKFKSQGTNTFKEKLELRLKEYCKTECADDSYPGGEPTIVVEEGKAQRLILELAEKYTADMIIMGTRTHSSLGDGLLGSTATKVIHRSKIPVLIYPL